MEKFGLSQPMRRIEDARFLRGAGAYVDDVAPEAERLHAAFLRSPVAHGRIAALDVSAARAAPGVRLVLTGAELAAAGANELRSVQVKNRDGTRSARPPRPALAVERVRCAGEAAAIVVADSAAAARDALDAIILDVDALDAVADMDAALAPGAPQLHDAAPGNLCFDWALGDEAAVDAALAASDRMVTLELENNRVVSNPMETRGVVASWDPAAERLTVETNTQGVWGVKSDLAARFGLAAEQVRVVTRDVGGGFGTKTFLYPEHVAVAAAARAAAEALGRKVEVKWVAERSEGFLTDAMGRDHRTVARAGFDAERRLTALKVETRAGMGAHLSGFAPAIPTQAASRVLTGVYDVQTAFYGVKGVFTNTAPVDAYRGAGRPETIYMLERLMDEAARALGMDGAELRRRNFVRPDQMPYATAAGETYDTGDFDRVLSAAMVKADAAGFPARRAASEAAGKLRGFGLCCYIEAILGDPSETAAVTVTQDGWVEIGVGTQSNGQGHETAYAQILAARCGLPADRVRLVQGDSDRVSAGGGTGGSRSVTMQGTAIQAAADALALKLRPMAEEELEASAADLEFRDGAYWVVGSDRRAALGALAARAHARGRADLAEVSETTKVPGRSYPNGCHAAEVEVDPETGAVSVARYTMVDDFGTLINPLLAEGQAQGGVVQGLGQALLERTVYDPETAQLLSGSFMDYAMPRAADAPYLAFHVEPTPSVTNPLGMKGCGEAGTVGALAAVTNAARDALAPLGVARVDMPLTPARVWALIQAARA